MHSRILNSIRSLCPSSCPLYKLAEQRDIFVLWFIYHFGWDYLTDFCVVDFGSSHWQAVSEPTCCLCSPSFHGLRIVCISLLFFFCLLLFHFSFFFCFWEGLGGTKTSIMAFLLVDVDSLFFEFSESVFFSLFFHAGVSSIGMFLHPFRHRDMLYELPIQRILRHLWNLNRFTFVPSDAWLRLALIRLCHHSFLCIARLWICFLEDRLDIRLVNLDCRLFFDCLIFCLYVSCFLFSLFRFSWALCIDVMTDLKCFCIDCTADNVFSLTRTDSGMCFRRFLRLCVCLYACLCFDFYFSVILFCWSAVFNFFSLSFSLSLCSEVTLCFPSFTFILGSDFLFV